MAVAKPKLAEHKTEIQGYGKGLEEGWLVRMKSVLISIQPKWCELIASGKKTVEVRKTRPKLETPFKVYIYMTKNGNNFLGDGEKDWFVSHNFTMAGKVIGEFVCDRIFVADCDSVAPFDKHTKRYIDKESCLSKEEFVKYTRMLLAYGWHISNLVIYDNPIELSEFVVEGECDCQNCRKCKYFEKGNGYNVEDDCFLYYDYGTTNVKPLFRPPQSWCYVEE